MYLAATRLREALAGHRLLRTDFRVPALATVDLSGQSVGDVASRGKHLLLRTDAGLTLHTHFGMAGSWELIRPGGKWPSRRDEVRVVLETDARTAVGIRLKTTEVFATDREDAALGHLGPDVLGPDWEDEEALRRLRERPEREIGVALIDQRVMAGPGNVYKSEVCFLRGVDPRTPVEDVPALDEIVRLMKRLMEANRTTGRQITTGDTRPGRGRWVYGRARLPCRRCGTPIQRTVQSSRDEDGAESKAAQDRVTYWCPRCQPSRASPP